MLKTKKKWLFIVLLIIVIAIVAYFKLSGSEESAYVTEAASIQDLKQTVEVTGTVEAADEIDLNFKTPGTLSALLVDVGDSVESGQVLARLYSGDIASQVQDARAQVDIAQSDLDRLLAGASTADIRVTEEEVEGAKTTYQSSIDTLENLKATRDQELEGAMNTALNVLSDKYFVVKYSLDVVYDAILDDEAKDNLYVSSVNKLNEAKNKYNLANNSYVNTKTYIDQALTSGEYEDILTALDKLELLLEQTSDSLVSTFEVMLVVINNTTYTTTVVDTFKSAINTQNTAINTAIASVYSSASGLRDDNLYYKNKIKEQENNVIAAKNSLELAQARLNLKKSDPRDFEIKAAEANVARAQATLNRYLSNLSEYTITSPIDGVITQANFEVGEQTSMSKPAISLISASNMQIAVDVPESDINKVEMGDQIEITLDAFSSDDKFSGHVTFIDPAATIIEGVTYYKVKVVFDENDPRLKVGMTADLTISTEFKQNVLVVPSRAIIYRDKQKIVQILQNGIVTEKEVTTGLRGDGGLTEILSGLEDGEQVITFVKTAE